MKQAHARLYKWLLIPLCLCLICMMLTHCSLLRVRREQSVLTIAHSASVEFGVPLPMILSVIRVESDFRPDAVSRAGARGLMQLLPDTYSWLCEEKLAPLDHADQIDDPFVNVRYGTYYLSYLYDRFGEWRVALAAYNAGEGRVAEWLTDPALTSEGLLVQIPFAETDAYVQQVLDYYDYYLKKYPQNGNWEMLYD